MREPGVRWILAQNPSPMTLDGTRTYLVGRSRPAIVDPGPEDERHVRNVLAALAGATPVAIVLTHSHRDHSGGAAALADATGAPIWRARAEGSAAGAPARGEHEARQGDEIATDDGLLRVVDTPGHSPDHIALHWTGGAAHPGGAVFVGDLMMGEGDTTLVAPPEGHLRSYLKSLEVVGGLGPEVLYPAHGPPILDPAAALRRYRLHRQSRIDHVRDALAARPGAGAGDLVTTIYGKDLDPRLRVAAAGSISAIVEYLREADAV